MSHTLKGLMEHLELEPLEENLYRGQSQDLGWGRVYGGQILGQALSAATKTVTSGRPVHSLHCYFLLPGDVHKPVVYQVERVRDGGSFATRRVVAIQHGRAILTMEASFHIHEESFDHQDPFPDVPGPEELPDDRERLLAQADELHPAVRAWLEAPSAFETRTISPIDHLVKPTPSPPTNAYWLRARGSLPDQLGVHSNLLAYASDSEFLTTALKPHGKTWIHPGVMIASLDHAMWFHRPFRLDDWLLYVIESPSAMGARAIVQGKIFTRDGRLVVSTAQEGLVRKRRREG